MRAWGRTPNSLARLAARTTTAAALSLRLDALPAVTVPAGSKAGFRARSFCSLKRWGSSSLSTTTVSLRPLISTGTISSEKKQSFWAWIARW